MQHAAGGTPPPGRDGPPHLDLIGWLWIACVSGVAMAVRLRGFAPGPAVAAALLYLLGQTLALGLVMAFLGGVWRRLERFGRWRWLPAGGAAWLFSWTVLDGDLAGPHERLPAWVPLSLTTLLAALTGVLLVWLILMLARRVAGRRWGGALCLAAGGGLAAAGATNFPMSYPGLHLLCVLVAGWTAQLGVPWLLAPRPSSPHLGRLFLAVAATGAAIAVLRRPDNAHLLLLLREPAAALAPYLAQLRPALQGARRIPESQRQWFQDRSALPPIPPSSPPLVRAPVVVMLGIDSMRADLMADPRRRAELPELFRLRDQSTFFSNARSPGSSTVPAFTAVFSGLYYSQMYWRMVAGAGPDVYPDLDDSPRFPQLLSDAGVITTTFDGVGFLRNKLGVTRGYREEQNVRTGRAYASGHEAMNAAIARLERASDGPLFLFLHLMEPHSPYNRGGQKATPLESYVAEVGLADRELGRLRQALQRDNLKDRAILIVLSDHGEAFGEHGMTWHGLTLYDELLRVPLMIWAGAGQPRAVADPVSLIDLGPTVLDLMGVATPPRYMGQSLVPYLRGQRPVLTRPILAEARLKQALVTDEGMKIIYDTLAQTVELFDLRRDPGEEHNLFGTAGDELLDVVRTFFQVHTLRRPGYRVPYRKW